MYYQYITSGIGLVIGMTILFLIRKSHLHSGYAVWWFFTAAVIIVFGSFPNLMDEIGYAVGVSYPPVLLVVMGVCIMMVKILTMDIERTKQEKKMRRLIQRLAILEAQKKTNR